MTYLERSCVETDPMGLSGSSSKGRLCECCDIKSQDDRMSKVLPRYTCLVERSKVLKSRLKGYGSALTLVAPLKGSKHLITAR